MEDMEGIATVSVPKKLALKGGKLRKGCRFSGHGVRCTADVAARLGKGKKMKRGRGKRGMPHIVPKTPQAAERMRVFAALNEARRGFKRTSTTCEEKRWFGRKITEALRYLGAIPGKVTRKNPTGSVAVRNQRYGTEVRRVAAETAAFCAHPHQQRGRVASSAAYEAHMARMRREYGQSHVSGVRR